MLYVLPWGRLMPNRIRLFTTNTIIDNLPFNKSRTKALHRIGPHNSIIIDI
jgi:hypothetical protein